MFRPRRPSSDLTTCLLKEFYTCLNRGWPEGKRPLGRPRRRWEDNIKLDLREVGGLGDWMELAQDKER